MVGFHSTLTRMKWERIAGRWSMLVIREKGCDVCIVDRLTSPMGFAGQTNRNRMIEHLKDIYLDIRRKSFYRTHKESPNWRGYRSPLWGNT